MWNRKIKTRPTLSKFPRNLHQRNIKKSQVEEDENIQEKEVTLNKFWLLRSDGSS